MQTLKVNLAENSYAINIDYDLLSNQQLLSEQIKTKQVMVVSNKNIAKLYLDKVLSLLKNFEVETVILPDGEEHKTLENVNTIYNHLLKAKFNRNSCLIALGGGVIGDITGFAAASYQRGISFIQIPTTLLAQVDSSVGGKTGVNHPLGKNMIGAFHQPKSVMIDIKTLETLPNREFSSGIAEVIKYGLIMDLDFFEYLEKSMPCVMSRKPETLINIIKRSCAFKAQIVADDEFEKGKRALLNLGHTFGHAIENASGYTEYLHGEAVAIGMVMAAKFSQAMGYLKEGDVTRIIELLEMANLPIKLNKKIKKTEFSQAMMLDKKAVSGKLRFILLKSLGHAIIVDDYNEKALNSVIDSFLS